MKTVTLSLSKPIPEYKSSKYWAMEFGISEAEVLAAECRVYQRKPMPEGFYSRYSEYQVILITRELVRSGVIRVVKVA